MKDIKISVIIPTLEEEKYLEKCLRSIVAQNIERDAYEIIVVDGGSRDGTIQIAKKYADRVISSRKRGIGHQQNVGAEFARGDILVFIHADTYFIKNDVFETVLKYFEDEKVVGGAISHKYYPEDKYNIKVFNQASFVLASVSDRIGRPNLGGPVTIVRKSVFNEIGGFVDNICEDLEINRRLRKKGKILRDLEIRAYSSSRRFEKEGVVKNLMRYALSQLILIFGIEVEINYPPIR
jgi:glycosyltransferase involved in cell wall biosynthesis